MAKIPICKYCGKTDHFSIMCFDRPRTPLKKKNRETYDREIETKFKWFDANPGPLYECYLQISPNCPATLTRENVVQEHVIPKVRGEEFKYNIDNIRPSCFWCNNLKGSQTLEVLANDYPQLNHLII